MKFKILHTNDLHSQFENFAKVKTIIDEYRDECTLVFDGGDFADFKRMELMGTKGALAGRLLELAHYDAITVGNNETFQGIEMLENMAKSSKVPFLCCNMATKNGPLNHVLPYITLKKQNVTFLVIGISPVMAIFPDLMGFTYRDYIREIKRLLTSVPHEVSILVNHIGTKNDEQLIHDVEGIDILLSAHDHQLYPNAKYIQNTLNNSAGYWGEQVGYLEFDYQDGHLTFIKSNVLSTKDTEPNQEVLSTLKAAEKEAKANLSIPFTEIHSELPLDFIEECPIGNFIADALRDTFKSDIGLINSGIVSGGLKSGPVHELKLLTISPSPLNPTLFYLSGYDIKQALTLSLDPKICLQDGKGPGFRGIALGRLHVSGLEIYVKNDEIEKILFHGTLLEDNTLYSVASSDYLQRSPTYVSLKNNTKPEYHVEYIRDLMKVYLQKEEFVREAHSPRTIQL